MATAALAMTLAVAGGVAVAAPGDDAGLPQVQQQGNVGYVSGGVGLDESNALKHAAPHWPLALRFTGPGSDYLSDVSVRIADAKGANVLDTRSDGPYMLVKLPPGQYTVKASHAGQEQTHAVTIGSGGHASTSFAWSTQ